ncbi:MAG: family 20 glycosylhydrolase [Phycisphaerae bacterium]|nr:family 20 glycosylhydrolase [Phycisphaerae bacterium]
MIKLAPRPVIISAIALSLFNSISTFAKINVIPKPNSISEKNGSFTVNADTKILTYTSILNSEAQYLASQLNRATGFDLKIATKSMDNTPTPKNSILLDNVALQSRSLKEQAYILDVSTEKIGITVASPQGAFYAIQSLLQLLPPEIESKSIIKNKKWTIPCVEITDAPRFDWRGLMLDVSRHFYTKEQVKTFIDQMARYKFNTFHWHLTDDQGWRIEIKKYPKLTEIGAFRVPRQGYWWTFDAPQPDEKATDGGFYTQEEIREIVDYAAKRHITIVPEIDVPGHSMAALAAYPQLSCGGGPFTVNPGSKFYGQIENTICPSNDFTYKFLDDVFAEIAELFPNSYIHIGGDEAHKGFWSKCPRCQQFKKDNNIKNEHELQSYFIKRMEKILASKGKKLIGWDEILEGGLAPNARVMSWRGTAGGIKAAKMGHEVVMTPSPYYYLDLYQGDPAAEPKTYNMARLTDTYNFEPVPDGIDAKLILGIQGNLWTEEISEFRHAQYMTWPRSLAIAESAWSQKEDKNWPDFVSRAENHFQRMDYGQIKYARSIYDPIFKTTKKDDQTIITLSTEIEGLTIHYTFEGADPDGFYPQYTKPLVVPKNAQDLKVVTCQNGKIIGKTITYPTVK